MANVGRSDVQAIVLATPLWVILRTDVAFDGLRRTGRLNKGTPRMTNNRGDLCVVVGGSRSMASQGGGPGLSAATVVLLSARISG